MSEGDRPDSPEPSPWWTPGGAGQEAGSDPGGVPGAPPISYGAPVTEVQPAWSYGAPPVGETPSFGHIGSPVRGPDYLPPAPYPVTPGPVGMGQPIPGPPAPPAPASQRQWSASRIFVIALVAALLGGVIGGISGVAYEHGRVDKSASPPSDLAPSGPPLASGSPTPVNRDPQSVASIAAKLLPSVVTLNVAGSSEQGTGSGVIIRSDGYILTNNHVVAVAANGGTVTADFYKGRQGVRRASSGGIPRRTSPSSGFPLRGCRRPPLVGRRASSSVTPWSHSALRSACPAP